MEEREYVELRSEEVQEILGTPPGWLVRWGTLIVFVCIAALLGVAALISYPDVIKAKIVITTATPPVDVVARTDGYIARLFVKDKTPVEPGAVLAVLESTAKYDDVKRLDEAVSQWQQSDEEGKTNITPLGNLEIGEIQADYSAFVQDLANFNFGKADKSSSVKRSIGSIDRQIEKLEKSIAVDQKSMLRINNQLVIARDLFQKQKELYEASLISRVDFEKERQRVDDLERQYDALEENMFRKQNEILSLNKSKNETRFNEKEDAATSSGRLRQSLNTLRASLDKWKQTYVLTAPIKGQVSLNSSFFSEKQYVKRDEQVMAIVPPQSDKLIGRMSLPVAGSGKVQTGQRVILKLDSYPYYEFGTLQGRVASKSLVPKDNEYAIQVLLPEGLKTSFNRLIPFEQQLQGTAEIITEDKRFLQRIYEQVFAVRY